MPADKGFHDRIRRIQTGKTWAPEGVIHTAPGRGQEMRGRRGGAGLSLLMLLSVPAALLILGPERLPEPVVGFFTAPTTEAALASLDGWAPFAGIGR